jgi:Nif-specific regulatory protein
LRRRQDDIERLAMHFLNELNHHYERSGALNSDAFDVPGALIGQTYQQPAKCAGTTRNDEDSLGGAKIKRSLASESAINLPQQTGR